MGQLIELTYTQNAIEIGTETNDLESNHLQLNHEAPGHHM